MNETVKKMAVLLETIGQRRRALDKKQRTERRAYIEKIVAPLKEQVEKVRHGCHLARLQRQS